MVEISDEFAKFLKETIIKGIANFVVPDKFKKEWDKMDKQVSKIVNELETQVNRDSNIVL